MEVKNQELRTGRAPSTPRVYPISPQQYIECREEAARVLEWAQRQGAPELDCRIAQALAMAECLCTLFPPGWTPPPGFSY